MSRTAVIIEDRASAFPLPYLLTALDALGVEFCKRGEALALKNAGILTAELRQAVMEHKPSLLILCGCRAELDRLGEYVIRLRCEDPPKGTRAEALVYLARQIEKLAAQSVEVGGTAEGWHDPADVFAEGDQIAMMRSALAELEAGPYPLPLPDGYVLLPQANFDPFEYERLYNGVMARCRVS